ncbi:S41 family peptidase [Sinomicrobium soli]|uniref:S41 family peptidase n=1 Tax=Sinomicrobium sp. N-1-3-6 TaxID=2219864 RepID=UPI000DCE8551|nr:S41 family peptidase [Sinomicrobium sp. N-1-3-6]RAV30335.1 peptidase S41 [Sinomicrobium sp. N-1-3-6]
MKKFFYFLLTGMVLWSCSDNDDETFIPHPSEEYEIQDFVWKGLNEWYFWQEDVENLGDGRFASNKAYEDFLNTHNSPEALFEDLLYRKDEIDRFSWIVDDYEVLLGSFRGESESFGFEIGDLVKAYQDDDAVIMYVGYVIPNSPASEAGIKRGDIIYKVDDVELNTSNYQVVNNFYNNTSIKLGFATVEDNVITPTGNTQILNTRTVLENPVHHSEVISYNNKKIGYLVYNGFRNTYNGELNDIFEDFKGENIDELVLDLRYNGGGSVETCTYLASMIYGKASASDVFAESIFNTKNTGENTTDTFADKARIFDKSSGNDTGDKIEINRISSLSRLYVLTSAATASASEMIINGLRPYMEVVVVGDTTYGKNVGSFTLFDSPTFDYKDVNPNHLYAMQPITFTIYNKDGESDYTHGFTPDIPVFEYNYWDDIRPFGDTDEALLATALQDISGLQARSAAQPEEASRMKGIRKKPFSREMYITPGEMKSE